MSLERFHKAQAEKWEGYATALAEIPKGHKSGHWIWYVFRQLDRLGSSWNAQEFALRALDEACVYLRDPILRRRYAEIAAAVAEQLTAGVTIEHLMGGVIDARKIASSLTLFRAAGSRLAQHESGFIGLTQNRMLKNPASNSEIPLAK